jgi:hypothetical protein
MKLKLMILLCSKFKSWKVTGMLPWSALLFTVGFILRTVGAFGEWDNLAVYIASTVFLLAAPYAPHAATAILENIGGLTVV